MVVSPFRVPNKIGTRVVVVTDPVAFFYAR